MPLVKGDRYKVGRGNSIYDNVNGEMWIVNDEDIAKIDQAFETCVVLNWLELEDLVKQNQNEEAF